MNNEPYIDFGSTQPQAKLPEGWYEATIITVRFDVSPRAGTPMAVLVLQVPESRKNLTFYLFLNNIRLRKVFLELLTTLNITLEPRKYTISELESIVEPLIGKRVKFYLYHSKDGYYRIGGFRPSAYEHTHDYEEEVILLEEDEKEEDEDLPPF